MNWDDWQDALAEPETPWTEAELRRARTYIYEVWWSDPDQLYLARCVELLASLSHGRTHAEAIDNAVDAVAVLIDAALHHPSNPHPRIPEPVVAH
jgi:predicted RNase H-like HicB family nuclease